MKYQIRGANKTTGQDVITEIEAENEKEAISIANSEGILVSTTKIITSNVIVPNVYVMPPLQPQIQQIQQNLWNPAVAAILSFFIPGLGQIYKGQILNGICWFFTVLFGYIVFILPGIILHICCIIGAAIGNPNKYK